MSVITIYNLGISHTCDLINYCNCVNYFLHSNHSRWTKLKCECTHLVKYNPLLNLIRKRKMFFFTVLVLQGIIVVVK